MGSLSRNDASHLEATFESKIEKYTLDHTQSKKNHDEACKYLPGGNTRTVLYIDPFPLTIASGHGPILQTVDGFEYVDFLGEYTAGIYGHSHPVIRKAVEDALDKGWNYGGQNPMEKELARMVCERFEDIEKVRFVNSGTEANMMAIATAVACTGKTKVLIFRKGYHGSTISGRVPDGMPNINLPHDFVLGDYNDVQGTEDLLKSLPLNSLAAIIVEPMLGSGGCYAASHDFLTKLRDLATEYQAILIFDEVMTSRLSYKGLGAQMGVCPDMMTLGKWIGGGMSFGAFGGRQHIMDYYHPSKGPLQHPGTFNNNVFTMYAGVAGLNLLDKRALNKLNLAGDTLREDVEEVFADFGLIRKMPDGKSCYVGGCLPDAPVTDAMQQSDHLQRPPKMFIKGKGSLLTIHFAGPDRAVLQGLFYHHMLENGMYLAPRGFIALNIELREEHYTKFVNAFKSFCEEFVKFLMW